jgi:hypothetical protein
MSHRVFTSFRYEDAHYARLLDAWAANENHDFSLYNERLRVAIDSSRGVYIRRLLRARIVRAGILLCLIGDRTWSSTWVKWEIETARAHEKGLVGVMLKHGNRVPVPMRDAGALFVPFNQSAMEQAISERARRRPPRGDWRYRT